MLVYLPPYIHTHAYTPSFTLGQSVMVCLRCLPAATDMVPSHPVCVTLNEDKHTHRRPAETCWSWIGGLLPYEATRTRDQVTWSLRVRSHGCALTLPPLQCSLVSDSVGCWYLRAGASPVIRWTLRACCMPASDGVRPSALLAGSCAARLALLSSFSFRLGRLGIGAMLAR